MNKCDERQGGSLSHSQGSQHDTATLMRGILETSERAPLERTITFPRMVPTDRGNIESSSSFKGSENWWGEKHQEKLDKADTSWWIWLINYFVNTCGSIIWGSLDVFSKGAWRETSQGRGWRSCFRGKKSRNTCLQVFPQAENLKTTVLEYWIWSQKIWILILALSHSSCDFRQATQSFQFLFLYLKYMNNVIY